MVSNAGIYRDVCAILSQSSQALNLFFFFVFCHLTAEPSCRTASTRNPTTASSLVTVESASVHMAADAVYVYRRGNFLPYFGAFSDRGRIEERKKLRRSPRANRADAKSG